MEKDHTLAIKNIKHRVKILPKLRLPKDDQFELYIDASDKGWESVLIAYTKDHATYIKFIYHLMCKYKYILF